MSGSCLFSKCAYHPVAGEARDLRHCLLCPIQCDIKYGETSWPNGKLARKPMHLEFRINEEPSDGRYASRSRGTNGQYYSCHRLRNLYADKALLVKKKSMDMELLVAITPDISSLLVDAKDRRVRHDDLVNYHINLPAVAV